MIRHSVKLYVGGKNAKGEKLKHLLAGLLILTLCAGTADAKTTNKTARARVVDAFAVLEKHLWHPKAMMVKRSAPFDHSSLYTDGNKLWIFRECLIDIKQDPGETSCRMIFGAI